MISIIITSLNENPRYLYNTLNSIIDSKEVKNTDIEIIVIDDASDAPVFVDKKFNGQVKLHRNSFRVGVANSRHMGATFAKNPWLLFTDAHMLFHPDWLVNFKEYSKDAESTTIYNGTCLGLWEGSLKYNDYHLTNLDKLPHYYGARLSLWEEKTNQVLEGKWLQEKKDEDNYEITCLMGAIYFIQKDFFFKIRGLSDLKMWGSDEPCLSLKTLLSNGSIRQLKNVKAAHIFRDITPYITESKYLLYNKIRLIKTLFPIEIQEFYIEKLKSKLEYEWAMQLINRDKRYIDEYRSYYEHLFVKKIYGVGDEHQIKY